MPSVGFTYWQDEQMWLGYLNEFPEYMTQGSTLEDIKEHLADLYHELKKLGLK